MLNMYRSQRRDEDMLRTHCQGGPGSWLSDAKLMLQAPRLCSVGTLVSSNLGEAEISNSTGLVLIKRVGWGSVRKVEGNVVLFSTICSPRQ